MWRLENCRLGWLRGAVQELRCDWLRLFSKASALPCSFRLSFVVRRCRTYGADAGRPGKARVWTRELHRRAAETRGGVSAICPVNAKCREHTFEDSILHAVRGLYERTDLARPG